MQPKAVHKGGGVNCFLSAAALGTTMLLTVPCVNKVPYPSNRKISFKAQKCLAIFFTGTAVLVVIRIVNERPAVLFLILCSIDFYRFDEKLYWWYIKRKEMPEHRVISTFSE